MMKKFLMLCAALFACGVLHAEGMQFVTWLSSPLGTFSQLETSDPSIVTYADRVNFCTTREQSGRVNLYKVDPNVDNLFLSKNTILTGNLVGYYTEKLTIADRGTVKGKSLYADLLQYTNSSEAKSMATDLILENTASFMAGSATQMDISGVAKIQSPATPVSATMYWSNKYECEGYNKSGECTGKNDKYTNSFLLKSEGTVAAGGTTPTPEPEPQKFNCITKLEWKTVGKSSRGWWSSFYSAYTNDMVCGDGKVPLKQYTPGTLGGRGMNCGTEHPGQYALYAETYECSANSAVKGYWCLYCGEVTSESQCITQDPPSMSSQTCSYNATIITPEGFGQDGR